MQKNNYFWILGILALLIIGAGIFFYIYSQPKKTTTVENKIERQILIGFSMGTLQEERWQKDRDQFLKRAKEMGVIVDLQTANNNTERQIAQIESMIIKKVDILVIAPNDASALSEVVAEAKNAGIKVISYDRLISNSNIDLYLSFDNEKVGRFEAQSVLDNLKDKLNEGKILNLVYIGGAETDYNSVLLKKGSFEILKPYIDDKKVKIVLDKFTTNWSPENAYQNLKSYLNTTTNIDGVICANDGTAFGVIRALQEYGLAGKIPVSGQDAELASIKRIVQGIQTSTVYKPVEKLANMAVEMAIKMVDKQQIATSIKTNNGIMDVPTILLDPINVTKENLDETIIRDGYHTPGEIYKK